MSAALLEAPWVPVRDGDLRALGLFRRHYTYRRTRPRACTRIVGPGERIVLLTPLCDALFIWRRFRDDSGQTGVNCAAFRNESPRRASDLIREACALAWQKWCGVRLYTYVDPRKVAGSVAGYCFRRAGWRRWGWTQGGLLVLERWPRVQPGDTCAWRPA